MFLHRRHILAGVCALVLGASPALAQKNYGPGVTDTEIKIGNIMPYSGPASAYGIIGKTLAAYFGMINEKGGINGRKINFITYDDGYNPAKTVEDARKLVEDDGVALILAPLGTPTNSAIHKYMNVKKVPQLFIASGATKWGDPKNYPWSMGFQPNYQSEAIVYAKYILQHYPNEKIGVLYQNDDFGKDYLAGLKDGLGSKSSMIVAEVPYEVTAPTIDSEMVKLKALGTTLFINITTPKFAAQAIRKAAELEWKPIHIMTNVSSSIGAVLKPAGFENAKGILTAGYVKDATDPVLANDAGVKEFKAFVEKYIPNPDLQNTEYGFALGQTMMQVLKQCGDDLTRENIMKQAANLKAFKPGVLLDGITVNTSPTDYFPINRLRMARFNGERWEYFGPIIEGRASS
ncbi:MAG: ABC transporter substrate-binding protein [Rhodomicrobium sp.]